MKNAVFTFEGMNNVLDSRKVGQRRDRTGAFSGAVDMVNIDPGNNKLRMGCGMPLFSGNYSGMFSNDEVFLVADGSTLKSIYPETGTSGIIKQLSVPDRCDFADTPVGIAVTNGVDIGLVNNNVWEDLPTPPSMVYDSTGLIQVPSFKLQMFPGKFIEWHAGKLWTLAFYNGESWLYFTDGYNLVIDSRSNYYRFPGQPKMLRACETGLYISAGNKTYYLGDYGEGPETVIAPYGAIPYAAAVCKPELFLTNGNKLVIWASDRGFCTGMDGGNFQNLSQDKVSYAPGQEGSAMVREQDGLVHFLASMWDVTTPYNDFNQM